MKQWICQLCELTDGICMHTLCSGRDCAFHAALSKCPVVITGLADDSSLKGHPELKCLSAVNRAREKICAFVMGSEGDLTSVNVLHEH